MLEESHLFPEDIERFTKPISVTECELGKCIETIIEDGLQKFGSFCDIFLDNITDAIYEKWAHNSSHGVRNDKKKKILEYTEYLNHAGLSEDQKTYLLNTYFSKGNDNWSLLEKGNLTNETVAWLWCFYPDKKKSLAALYENKLKNELHEYIKDIITSWKKYGFVKDLQACVEH